MESDGLIDGFEARRLPGEGVELEVLIGGSGPALLLLHGYPQTRVIWRAVATRLLDRFTLIIPDLRGYGRSDKPACTTGELYSKRLMARDQIAMMKALGFHRFFVAGHDRGGRVAYRLALDAPGVVNQLAVIDIIPTADVWQAGAHTGMGLFHWSFLAQPYSLPETLLEQRSDYFLSWLFEHWSAPGFSFDTDNMNDYLVSFRDPAVIRASCSDYRAGWFIDRLHDVADQGRHYIHVPLLALWGRDGAADKADPLKVWRNWGKDVSGIALPGGHFVPEEAAKETAEALIDFFA